MGGEGRKDIREVISERHRYYDILWVSRPHNINLIMDIFNELGKDARDFVKSSIVFDGEAIYSMRDMFKFLTLGGAVFGREIEKTIKTEIRHYAQADHVICVNEVEARLMQVFGVANIRILGHVLETEENTSDFKSRNGLLFVGALKELDSPNFDSLAWFMEHVWDALRIRAPEIVKLTVVGPVSDEGRRILARPGVEFTGRVDDLAPHVNEARVFIAPTRYAAGIPHKVHESVSRGLPAVVTPLLASQIGWPPETGYLIADWRRPEEFCSALHRLATDEDLWTSVRYKGLDAVKNDCNKEGFLKCVRDICEWSGFTN